MRTLATYKEEVELVATVIFLYWIYHLKIHRDDLINGVRFFLKGLQL